jgi:hypothetical protein
MSISLPFLTSYDPPGTSEGALDPLGLYQIANQLAVQLVPAVRERMQRIRFLTAMTVSALVTNGIEDDPRRDASPALVWEWLVVEALVREARETDGERGVPGTLVTRRALEQHGYLDARSYLKTPRIFGFHGVYKRLAIHLGLVDVHLGPGPNAEELLDAWARDLGHAGVSDVQAMLARWSAAVRRSLAEKPPRTRPNWSNDTWAELAHALAPSMCRSREKRFLRKLLHATDQRRLGALPAIWQLQKEFDEGVFREELLHDRLQQHEPSYRPLLGAIRFYEMFAPSTPPSKAGFLAATYRAGDERRIFLRLDPAELPEDWHILAQGQGERELLSASQWRESGCPPVAEITWTAVQSPERLRVSWGDCIAFLPLNVEDSGALPPPSQLDHMSADDMLLILAAADPSAAIRAMTRRQRSDSDDADLDTAAPIDLDPLRRYDLRVTFLHRIRRRSRFLAQLRTNLERPVWGRQALDWRLRGLIGIQSLADRLVREFTTVDGSSDEALLNLADLLIVLREVDYQPSDGALPKNDFEEVYRAFLSQLAGELHQRTEASCGRVSPQVLLFWERVLEECRS